MSVETKVGPTPGPWTAERPRVHRDVSSIRKISVSARTPQLIYVADLCGPALTVEANARLIAAAPELLAALTALVNLLNDDLDPEQCAAWDAARAVIAKAKGATP